MTQDNLRPGYEEEFTSIEVSRTVSSQAVDSQTNADDSPLKMKKKTRVSDLISRLSSSTAASRAKADAAKDVKTGIPRSRNTSMPSSTAVTTPTRPVRPGGRTQDSKIPSPWTKNAAGGRSPRLFKTTSMTASPADKSKNDSNSGLQRSTSHSTLGSGTALDYKRVSYTGGPAPNSAPPTSGLPTLHRAASFSPSPLANRARAGSGASSMQVNLFPQKTVRPRLSLGSTYGAGSLNGESRLRVEDLRSKIYELEAVLDAERADREMAIEWLEQNKSLNEALSRERLEKEALKQQLAALMDGHQAEPHHPNGLLISNGEEQDSSQRQLQQRLSTHSSVTGPRFSLMSSSPLVSEADTLADCNNDEMKALNSYLPIDERASEGSNSKADTPESNVSTHFDQDINNTHILRLETVITMLRADNSALRRETEASHHVLQEKENYIGHLKGRIEALAHEVNDGKKEVSDKQLEMVTTRAKLAGLETTLRSKEDHVRILETSNKQKSNEIDDMKSLLEKKDRILQEALEARDRVNAENGELKNQLLVFQTSRKPLDTKMQTLERDYRLAQRTIADLEVALQDLKLSVEEKEIENDELNRSIQAVMDQAKLAIGGAKRHSLLAQSPSPAGSSTPATLH